MDGLRIGQSALSAADVSLSTTANNIANVNTNGFRSRSVNLVETSGGGVEVGSTPENTTPGPLQGAETASNVDIATEMVNLIRDERFTQFNAAGIKAQDEVLGTILDLKR